MPVSLNSVHQRRLRECEYAAPLDTPSVPGFSTTSSNAGARCRLLELQDRNRKVRHDWLNRIFRPEQVFHYSQSPTRYLAQAEHGFEVLLISGDDTRRLLAIIRETRAVLPEKAIIPVLSNCTPDKAADLIGRGADDILHCAMDDGEAQARLHALLRRLGWAKGERRSAEADEAARRRWLDSFACGRPTPMEACILKILVEREGHVVPYFHLSSQLGRGWDGVLSRKSLQVLVCNLRRKLVGGVQIVNRHGSGYLLVRQEMA